MGMALMINRLMDKLNLGSSHLHMLELECMGLSFGMEIELSLTVIMQAALLTTGSKKKVPQQQGQHSRQTACWSCLIQDLAPVKSQAGAWDALGL